MKKKLTMFAAAATLAVASTAAHAVSITFNPSPTSQLGLGSSGFADGGNIGDIGTLGNGDTVYLNPTLTVTSGGDVNYIFRGDDAGATNYSFSTLDPESGFNFPNNDILSTEDTIDVDAATVTVAPGLLNFAFCSDGTFGATLGCIANGEPSVIPPATGFSFGLAFDDTGRAFLLFGDGAGDADLSDMIVEITGATFAPVPLPAAAWMLLAGVGGLAAMKRRKKA